MKNFPSLALLFTLWSIHSSALPFPSQSAVDFAFIHTLLIPQGDFFTTIKCLALNLFKMKAWIIQIALNYTNRVVYVASILMLFIRARSRNRSSLNWVYAPVCRFPVIQTGLIEGQSVALLSPTYCKLQAQPLLADTSVGHNKHKNSLFLTRNRIHFQN